MKYNYETFVEDCLIGLFFKAGNKGTMQITQRINDSHYLCTCYIDGEIITSRFIYSLEELSKYVLLTNVGREYKMTNIEGVE